MNIAANTTTAAASAWELAATAPDLTTNRTEADIADWRRLTERVKQIAEEKGWTKAEAARRLGMAEGTFSGWFSGKYAGRLDTTNGQVAKFIDQQDEQASFFASIPVSPPYFPTRTSREVMETLAWAHVASDLVLIVQTNTCQYRQCHRSGNGQATQAAPWTTSGFCRYGFISQCSRNSRGNIQA